MFVPTIPSLIRRILYWKRRYPGIAIVLCKRDVKSAFKLAPLSIRMIYKAGLRVAEYVMIYVGMYFGWQGDPGNWGIISSLLMQFVANHKPRDSSTHDPERFEAYQFVDDGGFDDPLLGMRPWASVEIWETGLISSLGTKSQ